MDALLALTVLTVGILGFLISFQSNFRATQEIGCRDLAYEALESSVETLRAADFGALYSSYQGAALPAPGLEGTDGNPAVVRVRFDTNETALSAEYGPVTDIDGDGALMTKDVSTGYELLPTCLTLSYKMGFGIETKVLYLILGP